MSGDVSLRILGRVFYDRSPLDVAPDLLGKILCCVGGGVLASGRIVETEAYLGQEDPASHAYRGPTPRNQVMFGPPGFAYVYFTYGTHYCMNVVTGPKGTAGAVLIRALEPLEGLDAMKERRGTSDVLELCSGPGKLTQALGIAGEYNGLDLTQKPLWLVRDHVPRKLTCVRSPRIGITGGTDLPYRFYAADSPHVSRARNAAPKRPA